MKYLLAVAVAIIVLCKCVPAHADVNDDFGWAGDVGLVTGFVFELTNPPTLVQYMDRDGMTHLGIQKPDPLPAEVAMFLFDYGGQRALRGEPLIPDAQHPIGQVEAEEMLTAFAVNQGILIPIECLLHLR